MFGFRKTGLVLLVVLLGFGFVVSPVVGASIQSVSTGEASPGETVKISVTATEVGGIAIQNIPQGWSVQRTMDDGGIFVENDQNGDGHSENIGWAWQQHKQRVVPSVVLSVPQSTDPGQYNMELSARNGGETTRTISVTINNPQQQDIETNGGGGDDDIDENQNTDTQDTDNQDTETSMVSPVIQDIGIQDSTQGGMSILNISSINTSKITVSSIPTSWSIQSHQDMGSMFYRNDTNDNGNIDTVQWSWSEKQDIEVSAVFNISTSAIVGNNTVYITAENNEGSVTQQAIASISKLQQNQDTGQQIENQTDDTQQDTDEDETNQQNQQQPGFTAIIGIIALITIGIITKIYK